MSRQKKVKRSTTTEIAYVRDMKRRSALEMLDDENAEALAPENYPEPLKRFLRREAVTVHIRLSAPLRKKLDEKSRRAGLSADELARRWIKEALNREAI